VLEMKKAERNILIVFIVLLGVGVILLVNNRKELQQDDTYFAIYVEDEKVENIPAKDSGFFLDTEKSSCNNATISWDSSSWGAIIKVDNDVNSRVSCNLYFRKASDYEFCVIKYGSNSPQCKIIARLDTTGACPKVRNDGTVNVTALEKTNGYVCSAPDDYGTSYYFRGKVTNNYVKFGGYYWRIIRMNGDGSIRMIYAGDASVIDALDEITKRSVLANGYNDSTTKYTQIGESKFNESYDNNAYVGYMYGNINGATYEEVHANTNNSTIKKVVDNWYKEHLLGKDYEQYISDTLFCNNRSFSGYYTGIGKDETEYRWGYGPWTPTRNYPILNCKQQNDQFTFKSASFGNKVLTYPIGLITMDEIVLAGGYNTSNSGYYLYTGNDYWTISPSAFSGSTAYVHRLDGSGSASPVNNVITTDGVRPILSLRAGSLKSGLGTWNDPYTIN